MRKLSILHVEAASDAGLGSPKKQAGERKSPLERLNRAPKGLLQRLPKAAAA